MKKSLKKRVVIISLLGMFMYLQMSAQEFTHPGILHNQSDFDRMAERVNNNEEPWISSYNLLVNSSEAQLSWNPRATETVIRGGEGDNVSLLYRDVQAAYQHALLWKITGNTAHGDKARDILNAWSATHTTLTGNADRYLASGLFGYQFANAAEMMRGYSGFDVGRFQNYLLDVYYYPLVERFLVGNEYGADHNDACITNYWANWDLANMAAMIAIGVFCDDRGIYNQGIDYFINGAGNGSIMNAVPFIHSEFHGQWQESGRDQGHTILGVGLMASFCEIAWNQGDDMYGYDDNRFRKGAEYVAKYNMGESVPFTTYSWGSGQNCAYNEHTVISNAGRGEIRPIWEMIYNHYANRVGQGDDIGYIAAMASEVRPEAGPGGHGTTYDQPGFGSLTYYGGSASSGGSPSGGVSWESYNFPDYFIRHQNNVARIDPNVSPVDDKQWNMVDGLANSSGVSFESVNSPGMYLRHYNYELILDNISSDVDRQDATFYIRQGLADNSMVSFESHNFPGYFIRHSNYVLRMDEISTSEGEQDATFRQEGAVVDGSVVQLKNRGTGLVADGYGNTGNGDPCNQYASTTTHPNSQWEMIDVGSSEGVFYYFVNEGTGMKMDGYGRTENGSDVAQYNSSTTHINAQWSVEQFEGDFYRIKNRGTGLFLDGMGRTANGEALGQYANTSDVNAQWELVQVLKSAKKASQPEEKIADKNSDFSMYPNPVANELSIGLPSGFTKGEAEVFNLSGKSILKTILTVENPTINVAELNSGIYFLQITGDNSKWNNKFIKK